MWRQFRLIFGLQAGCTVIAAAFAALFGGIHGAISAALGGAIGMVAGLGFALMVAGKDCRSVAEVLRAAMRAESVKIILVVMLLWLALTQYQNVVAAGLVATFCLSIVIFSLALFVRESNEP